MTAQEARELKQGEEVYYAGGFYEIAELKNFPHGLMIGIYDEPGRVHVDYLSPESVNKVRSCNNCQNGCPVCGGYGRIVI